MAVEKRHSRPPTEVAGLPTAYQARPPQHRIDRDAAGL